MIENASLIDCIARMLDTRKRSHLAGVFMRETPAGRQSWIIRVKRTNDARHGYSWWVTTSEGDGYVYDGDNYLTYHQGEEISAESVASTSAWLPTPALRLLMPQVAPIWGRDGDEWRINRLINVGSTFELEMEPNGDWNDRPGLLNIEVDFETGAILRFDQPLVEFRLTSWLRPATQVLGDGLDFQRISGI